MAVGRGRERIETHGVELKEKVVQINRVAKVVKGGRRFSFSAWWSSATAPAASASASARRTRCPRRSARRSIAAKKTLVTVPLIEGTIPFEVHGQFGAGHVLLRPAADGTGVIAGGGVRAVVELAGVRNVLTKCIGSNNPHNMVKAAMHALTRSCACPRTLRRCAARALEEIRG